MSVRAGVFTVCLLSMLICLAGKAQAAPETIAGSGMDGGGVITPRGTAVDQANGNLYVADYNFLGPEARTARIDKFDSDGAFLLAWGWGVADGVSQELQTCGPEATPPTTHCFTPSTASSATGAGSISPDSVAVDSSGAVYVADAGRRRVTKFTQSGEFIYMVGKNVNATKAAPGSGATQAEKNICTAASGDTCQNGQSGTGANEFASPRSLAITSTGTVWVGDTNRLTSFFGGNGAPGTEITGGGIAAAGDTLSLAIDASGNFFVKSESVAGIRKLEAGTGTVLETLDAAGQARTVTLDEQDNTFHVYIGDATTPYHFKIYNSTGKQTYQFGAGEVIGNPEGNALSVGENAERLYVASHSGSERAVQAFPLPKPGPLPENQHADNLLPTTATLAATLNPESHLTTYHFEYISQADFEAEGESFEGPKAKSTGLETLEEGGVAYEGFDSKPVAAAIAELIPATTYHFRLCATNSAGSVCGPDTTFTTPPAVLIDPEWVSNVSAHSATLNAEMNPLGVETEEAWLEWGTSEGYGQIVPLANLGEGFDPVLRQTTLTGLQAATTYHYRFAAKDRRPTCPEEECIVHGADRIFTTQFGGLGFRLPDGRAWEMVSPQDKHGAKLVGGAEVHLQASADGEGLAYQSYLSTEADPDGNRILEPSMNLARRQADGSWRSKDITSPNEKVTRLAVGQGSEYKLFNSDLSKALLEPRSGTPLSPEASERTPYLRENTEPPVYTPLVTGKEPYANVPAGTEFGGQDSTGRVKLVAASPNFRHFGLLSEGVPLLEDAPASGPSLYEWSGGQIRPVSVLPVAEGGAVNASLIGSGRGSVRGAISEGGTRVFWSRGNDLSSVSALYVRDTQAEETGRLDVKQAGASGLGSSRPIFQGASGNGTVVFFTDSQQLTEDASSTGADLYRCELPPGSIGTGCASLIDISVPTEGGESAEVQGIAAAITDDGTKVYFVARGVLDEASNRLSDSAIAGQPNLYLWQQGEGVRFIATLTDKDRTDWGQESPSIVETFAGALTAAASPSGRYFGFMSQRSLTGYDNRDQSTGEAAREVFRYDATTEQLDCVSCNPTGTRPHSGVPSQAFGAFVDPWELWEGQPVAAALPEATSATHLGVSLYRPRAVLDNGRVFFNAIDSLTPADSNGQWDVYQYESTSVGDCSASSGGASVSRSAGGCVSLISSGTAEEEAAFFDADETGDNAFFWTPAQLNETDTDHEVDIYDARVDGNPATLPKATECLGEACQPAAQAPNDPTPASSTFNGAGNVKPARKHCGKGRRLVRRLGKTRCVSRKHRHKHKRNGGTSRRGRR